MKRIVLLICVMGMLLLTACTPKAEKKTEEAPAPSVPKLIDNLFNSVGEKS